MQFYFEICLISLENITNLTKIIWKILHNEEETCHEIQILVKVEKFLTGSLDSIPSPSPSVKIQIMGGKVCLIALSKLSRQ